MTEHEEQSPPPRRLHPLEAAAREAADHEAAPANETPPPPRFVAHQELAQPYATYILIGINVLIFLAGWLLPDVDRELFLQGASYGPAVQAGEFYRLFTAMFLHGDAMHIFFNAYALYIIGGPVERFFGHARFLLIYLLGGLGGSVLSVALGDWQAASVGASGAVFAILGAQALHIYQHREVYNEHMRGYLTQIVFLIFINLALGFAAPRIDNLGHIGGLLGGLALTWWLGPRFALRLHPDYPPEAQPQHIEILDQNPLQGRALPVVLAYAVVLVVLLVAGVMLR